MPNPYDENNNRSNPLGATPYADNGNRYAGSNNAGNNGQYRKGDAPSQIPWWIIILLFCIGAWPVSVIMLVLNKLIREGTIDLSGRRTASNRATTNPVYSDPARRKAYDNAQAAKPADAWDPEKHAEDAQKPPKKQSQTQKEGDGGVAALAIVGVVFAIIGALAGMDAGVNIVSTLLRGGAWWTWLEDVVPALAFLGGGVGMMFGAGKMKASRRMRKKIVNIVGKADHMYIRDIAASVPCSYEKCRGYLEDCIDKGVFGEEAFLDMRTACLVVRGKAPAPANTEVPKAQPAAAPAQGSNQYTEILEQLRRVNEAIPDQGMSDKINRLEAVSAKIFKQAEENPDKLPQMRKFMDYYLPTSLKLLQTYAELDAQGIEGENIRESKRRIEQSMDTLVVAFENQLDKLFQVDAMDVSADIDVMENMLRADGLSGTDPFAMPAAPQPPQQ